MHKYVYVSYWFGFIFPPDAQIENYNESLLNVLREYDDGRDLSNYNFKNDGFNVPYDDSKKRKLAYWHFSIAQKYAQVLHFGAVI